MRYKMEFKSHGSLPGKPSELIRIALKDIRKVEKSPLYSIYMDDWHVPMYEGGQQETCQVCMAGAVMAHTLDTDITKDVSPGNFDERHALNALNEFREGNMISGFYDLGIPAPKELKNRISVPPYDDENVEPFHGAMNYMANELERKGY